MKLIPSLVLILFAFVSAASHAKYQAPSAKTPITPGDRIENLYPQQLSKPYILQRLTNNVYWVSSHGYNAMFYVGKEGVLLFDPLEGGAGENVLSAIKAVTPLPITGLVYSHYHLDHIGDASVVLNSNNKMKIYATKTTTEHAKKYGGVPLPTEVISEPNGEFTFEGVRIELHTPPQGHTDDDTIFFIPSESVVHFVDMINPDQMPYLNFAGVQDFNAYQENLKFLLTLDWNLMNAGHGNIGTKEDVIFVLSYIEELKAAVKGTFGKIKSFSFQDPDYNHQRAVLVYKAAIVEEILPEFEKKYGHYYGFKEAFPAQVSVILGELQLYGTVE
jgi:glyoxylase-like metal-dependent hydrolase (beta-lactamase superfamily II)